MLELLGVTKNYGTTKALDNISITISRSKVTSIYGPNGAGKSTLVKIVCGEEKQDEGVLKYNGKIVGFNDYQDALLNGISYVPQDFGLLKNLTVLENIGITNNNFQNEFFFSRSKIKNIISSAESYNLRFPHLDTKVENLSAYEQQLLATHKALLFNSSLIIFDESTTNLDSNGFKKFKDVIYDLKTTGKTILFISHKLNEVFEISDDIVILNNGKLINDCSIKSITEKEIIQYFMQEKQIVQNDFYNSTTEICSINIDNTQIDISKGEILTIDTGDTSFNQEIGYRIFEELVELENLLVGIVPALRDEEAIFQNLSVKDNLLLTAVRSIPIKEKHNLENLAGEIAAELKLKFENWDQNITELSGGNKQKVVLARWIIADFDILVLIEPTAGIDIETKEIIHNKILSLKNEGKSFILISSDEGEHKMLQSRIIKLNKKVDQL